MISVVQLGTVDYATSLKLQQTLVELRYSGRIPNVLLLLEHPPVITLGRNADRRNILASPELLERKGVNVFECDRGGDVTYHGPGQLVGYPIFDLRSFRATPQQQHDGETAGRRTIGAVEYVRRMEEALIRTCADFGVPAERVKGMTGVWTAAGAPSGAKGEAQEHAHGDQSKIAAIGVHISRGITSHGFALNVSTDLDHFNLIVPCGITTKPVTSLSKERGTLLSLDAAAESVARNFGRVFNAQILWVETLDALLGQTVGVPMKPPEELRKLREEDTFWA
jgi:lipoyl(octanoyl) transferase